MADKEHSPKMRHIRIESANLSVDYKASMEKATQVAKLLGSSRIKFTVTIDDEVQDELRPLPCLGLWP